MKTLFVLITSLMLSVGALAQDAPKKDCIMMKDGKMMVMKDGITTPLLKDTIISKGTIVMTDGSVLMKDGTKATLKNDEYIEMNGKISSLAKKPSK